LEIKNIYGDVFFALEGAKTVLELVTAAVAAKKSLRGADLRDAVLSGADLSDAVLRGADLCGADLRGADLRGAVLRDGLEGVPVIPSIHQAIFDAASKDDALDMRSWHTCDTTHCRAGWVVTLAGPGGRALEWAMGTPAAAALIYMASDPQLERVPDFYASNEAALDDMKRLAETEAAKQ
jgi:Pentapeptide repeats (8 copies)